MDSWRSTYKDIVPSEFLASLSYKRRTEQWVNVLDQHAESNWVYVAESDQVEIVGFVSCGPLRERMEIFQAELYAIYLLQEWQMRGIGQKLFERAVDDMQSRGYQSMMLWVLENNPACAFYQRMGGTRVGKKEIEIGGARLTEIAFGWEEL